jgi:hypothetical protein
VTRTRTGVVHHNVELAMREVNPGGHSVIVQGVPWLPAQCWCGKEAVGVQQAEVKGCLTRSCGRATCRNPLTLEQVIGLGVTNIGNVNSEGKLCTQVDGVQLDANPGERNPARVHEQAERRGPFGERVEQRRAAERRLAPRTRAYTAPQRIVRDKNSIRRITTTRAEVALRRDIIQLCWEAGMTVKDIVVDLGSVAYQTIVNDLFYLRMQKRINDDHTPVNR